jgi:hypothetical protein
VQAQPAAWEIVVVFWRRRDLAVAVVSLVVLCIPAAAVAHLSSGTVAVDYSARIQRPDTDAYAARIYQSDRGLSMTIKAGHVVVLLGYLGEQVFRLDSAGLWVNAASPTAVVAGLLRKSQRVLARTVRWRLQRGRRSVTWHDARVGGLPPGNGERTWSVPLVVDGRPARLDDPSVLPWAVILGAVLAASAVPLLLRRRRLVRAVAIGFAVTAAVVSVVLALAFAFDRYASPGTWIAALDEIVFLVIGLGVLYRGPESLHVGAAVGLGLLGLAVGLSKGAVFFHPIVLAVLPATAIRLLVLAAIGTGAAAAALGSERLAAGARGYM